jgi:hypothetical protein
MKPKITLDALKRKNECFFTVFDQVAELADYKSIFRLQAFSGQTTSLNNALNSYYLSKSELTKKMEVYANDPINYNAIMQKLITNIEKFKNVIVPHRDSDFIVEQEGLKKTYFWINERIEIEIDLKLDRGFLMAKLNVDENSDSLLFHNGLDGWTEYEDAGNVYSGKVANKYKEYLAEKQLLKD